MQKYFISLEEFEKATLTDELAFQIRNVLRGRIGESFFVGVKEKTYLA